MGLFLDYSRPSRQDWKFPYKGSELLVPAQKKLTQLQAELDAAQDNVRTAVTRSTNMRKDSEVEKHGKNVERLGPLAEECQVFVHEFGRDPDRVFNLSISDVTFFDLHLREDK